MYDDNIATKLHELCKKDADFEEVVKQMEDQNEYVISQITHEIRNPLTLISSTAQLIESHYPIVAESRLWEQLTDDITDLTLLLEDVTTYNHSKKLSMDCTDLYDLLQKLINNFKVHTAQKNIHIQLDASNSSLTYLQCFKCDSIKLKQAFTNILKNAVEAIEKDGDIIISIEDNVKADFADIDTDFLTIAFKNNGEPIDPIESATIFKPFVTHKANGTGMGLAITEQIIKAHNGYIQCIFDDTWTEFKIFLPIC